MGIRSQTNLIGYSPLDLETLGKDYPIERIEIVKQQ